MNNLNGTNGVIKVKCVKPDINAAKSLLKIGGSTKTTQRIVMLCIVSLLTTMIGPVLSYISKLIIDLLTASSQKGNAELFPNVCNVVIVSFVLTVVLLALGKAKELLQIHINHDTSKAINEHIHDRLQRIKYEYYEDSKTYDVISRVTSNCPGLYSVLNAVIAIVTAIISTISYGILLGSIRWFFVLLILLPNTLYVIAETKNMFERYFLNIAQTNDNRKLKYMHSLFRDKKSNKEIRAFGLIDTLIDKYENLRISLYKHSMKLLLKQSIVSFFLLILSRIGLFICLIVVCIECVNGRTSIGDITLVLSAGMVFGSSFTGIFSQINSVTDKAIYLNDWTAFELMETEQEDSETTDIVENVSFVNVSNKYPNAENYALRNVSCEIHKGSTVALVGENGSGKSTFAKLLLGTLTPENGFVEINEIELSKVLHSFRDKTAYVPQNFGTFKMSLAENLKLGNEILNIDSYQPKFVNFLNKLPGGIETPLGNIYPNGVDLSGGEWQRISIERALLRKKAQLFIIDEPAASLDPIMESELYEHFIRELNGKTIIITSHRLGACSLADYIFVFDHGEIIEEGTHEFLMNIKGKYHDMYTAQRSLYERSAD